MQLLLFGYFVFNFSINAEATVTKNEILGD